jgi:NAD(P)-dependent dehydrogenase (short-subunit alcohol dehydrogenase family)
VGALTPSLNAAYCASKGAVVTLTKSMALDLSPRGVTANVICPGPITTEMTRERFEDPTTRAEQLSRARVGFFGAPSDVAAGAVYLASDDARFVTGSVLAIDAGWSIG